MNILKLIKYYFLGEIDNTELPEDIELKLPDWW
jgi:hypothetical protein